MDLRAESPARHCAAVNAFRKRLHIHHPFGPTRRLQSPFSAYYGCLWGTSPRFLYDQVELLDLGKGVESACFGASLD